MEIPPAERPTDRSNERLTNSLWTHMFRYPGVTKLWKKVQICVNLFSMLRRVYLLIYFPERSASTLRPIKNLIASSKLLFVEIKISCNQFSLADYKWAVRHRNIIPSRKCSCSPSIISSATYLELHVLQIFMG